jgi:hypothetical protein
MKGGAISQVNKFEQGAWYGVGVAEMCRMGLARKGFHNQLSWGAASEIHQETIARCRYHISLFEADLQRPREIFLPGFLLHRHTYIT